jgi:hypothetical protein
VSHTEEGFVDDGIFGQPGGCGNCKHTCEEMVDQIIMIANINLAAALYCKRWLL